MTSTKRHANFKDITNEVYGLLTVIKLAGFRKKKNGKSSLWLCQCKCGNMTTVEKGNLKISKSCGCLRGAKIKSKNEHVLNIIFNGYINKSKERNLEFKLSKDEFLKFITDICYYCGSKGLSETKYITKRNIITGYLKHNGIDRINNDLGYLLSNCVTCCKICNRAKSSMDIKDFDKWINDLIKFRSKNG